MGWFSKKDKEEDIPTLPDLPSLPDFPSINEEEAIPQLPSYPRNQTGNMFSQNSIKNAVSMDDMEDENREDYKIKEIPKKQGLILQNKEPLYIRIDRVESAIKSLGTAKETAQEMERILKKIKETKELEEKELKKWEEEIKTVKEKIDKASSNLFSRI